MNESEFALSCPIPISEYPHVLLAHGGGGTLMRQLIDRMFRTAFGEMALQSDHDAAVLTAPEGRLAFTTDSFVVHPLEFPGGNIGSLAVFGTVNDLAAAGARPLALSVGFILEEGLPMETLWRIVNAIKDAANRAGVRIVTGDTKVVDRGKGDGMYINTSGIGVVSPGLEVHPNQIRAGDAVIVNGDLGRHGIAIMAVREGLSFESAIESDCAPLDGLVHGMLEAGVRLRCARDLTRGGLASALNEIAAISGLGIRIRERQLPVREDVRGACEILGFDPLYVANEGRLVAFVPADQIEYALDVMRRLPEGEGTTLIGHVVDKPHGRVEMESAIGISRIIDMLSGEQLPRIC